MNNMPEPRYTWDELKVRIEHIEASSAIHLSNQYGMIFLLNEKGEILLNITGIFKE